MNTPELYFSDSSSSPSSTNSSVVHAASLVDPATHSTALLELVEIQLSGPVIDYIVDCVSETIDHAMGRPPTPRGPIHAKFASFVSTVLSRAEVTAATALTALVYIARARPHLAITFEEWALERVFLGALIVASKYTNDSTLRNVHWAMCTGVFGKRDVGRIEREMLEVLDWELGVSEADVLAHHEGVMHALPPKANVEPEVKAQLLAVPAQTRIHRRTPSIPELEHSSPASSTVFSLSPRTPLVVDQPASDAAPVKQLVDVPMDVSPQHGHTKSTSGSRFHDLLRAFPIPRHHRNHHRGQA